MEMIETLFIELTTMCNLHCIHCGYKNGEGKIIEYKYVEEMIQKCIPYGLKLVMLTGGEPTLHPELFRILDYCKECGLQVKLTTNGYRLYSLEKYLQQFLLDQVVISIDASAPETYEKIRGRNMLPDIWQDVEKLSAFRSRIHFSFLIQKANYRELLPFLVQCAKRKAKAVSLLVPHPDGDFTHTLHTDSYFDDIFLQQDDAAWFAEHIAGELCSFYDCHSEMFSFGRNHLDAVIQYITSSRNIPKVRESVCSLPLRTVFLYTDHTVRMCPYQSGWSYISLDAFLESLSKQRMKAIFDGSKKDSLCHHCLEVAL